MVKQRLWVKVSPGARACLVFWFILTIHLAHYPPHLLPTHTFVFKNEELKCSRAKARLTLRFLSFVGRRDSERRQIAQCERAADNRLSLTRQRDSCCTDSKIESVQLLLNQSERSFDQRRILR